jgi:hypothetical protein
MCGAVWQQLGSCFSVINLVVTNLRCVTLITEWQMRAELALEGGGYFVNLCRTLLVGVLRSMPACALTCDKCHPQSVTNATHNPATPPSGGPSLVEEPYMHLLPPWRGLPTLTNQMYNVSSS